MQIFSKVAIALALIATAVMAMSVVAVLRLETTRRKEMRRSSEAGLELLALAVAPAVAERRHDRAQSALDNVDNFARFPAVRTLEVLDKEGRVVAALDPRRYNTMADDPAVDADLALTEPTTRMQANGLLRVVVPLQLTHRLGALRAELSEERLEDSLGKQKLYAALLGLAVVLLLGVALGLVRRLEQLATKDPLTKLPNRRYFNLRAHGAVTRARRYGRKLSLVLLDLDRFKAINDNFHHSGGDRVLQRVSQVLLDTAREADLVARWGGEEMVVLMPETGLEAASKAAERMRKALKEATYAPEMGDWPVTASFGVAQLDEDKSDPEDAMTALLTAADVAMYAAKDAGRDRVFLATEDGPQRMPSAQEEAA